MEIRARPICDGGGLLIEAANNTRLAHLDRAEIAKLLRAEGLLLFRRFRLDDTEFHAFGRRFCDRFLIDPSAGRISQPVAAEVQTVVVGSYSVNLHFEYGVTPFKPDLVWFYCDVPATCGGGQTTVCDGVQVWRALSDPARKLLSSKRIEYTLRLPPSAWRIFFNIQGIRDAGRAELIRLLEPISGLQFGFEAGGVLTLCYRTFAAGPPRYRAEQALIGSILPDVYKQFGFTFRFEDGSALPPALLDELNETTARLTIALAWERADVVMIDNTRWLHGRRAFNDTRRRILTLCGYADLNAALFPTSDAQSAVEPLCPGVDHV